MTPGDHGGDQGAATAELAVAIPSLVLVLALSLAAVDLGIAHVRCVDAARTGARLLARGEPAATVLRDVRTAAHRGAEVDVETADGQVRVTVTGAAPRLLAPVARQVVPRATAVARLEVVP